MNKSNRKFPMMLCVQWSGTRVLDSWESDLKGIYRGKSPQRRTRNIHGKLIFLVCRFHLHSMFSILFLENSNYDSNQNSSCFLSNKQIIIQIPKNLPLRSPIHSHLSNSIEYIFIPPFSVFKLLFYFPKHEQFDKQQLNTFLCSWPHLPTNHLPPFNMKKHT